jgi:RimJ/RimL family protein N-acetyltransferase
LSLFSDRPEEINAFVAANGGGWECPDSYTALGSERDGKIIGGIVYSKYNGAHCLCNIALLPGYNHKRLIISGLHYGFSQLKLKRLTFIVASSNIASQTFVRHLGASLEATLLGADISGDLLIYSLFPETCPLWRRFYGKPNELEQQRGPAPEGSGYDAGS